MVRINIIVEGGVPGSSVGTDVFNNVEALRESLNRFFSRLLNRSDVQIAIHAGYGYRNAARMYIRQSGEKSLFVDSDRPADRMEEWFESLINTENPDKSIIIPAEMREKVYFMVQEMEAWFLKQPDSIELWGKDNGYERKRENERIDSHSSIRKRDIETLNKPSEKLALLIKTFFHNSGKGVKYGKLKSALGLLDHVDVVRLLQCDSELQRFVDSFRIR